VTDDRLEAFYGKVVFTISTFDMRAGDIPPPPYPNGRRGRPPDTVGNRDLQALVEMLWDTAKHCGGNLYADHKRDDGGTMIRALELLRPILRPISPASLPPKNLPVSTIETIIKKFKASGRTWFKITPK
jgi:hypothetical protein